MSDKDEELTLEELNEIFSVLYGEGYIPVPGAQTCTCGSAACGGSGHSSWCDINEGIL